MNETTVGNCVRAYKEKNGETDEPLNLPERARLRELERVNRELEMECAFLSKAAAYFASRASVRDKYEFIDAEYAAAAADTVTTAPAVSQMCGWLVYQNRDSTNGGTTRDRRRRSGGKN